MKHSQFLAAVCVLAAFAGCTENKITTSSYTETFTGRLSENGKNTITLDVDIEYPESGFSKNGLEAVREEIKEALYDDKYAEYGIQEGFRIYFNDLLQEYRAVNLPVLEEFTDEYGESPASLDWQYVINAHFSERCRNMVSYVVTKYQMTGGAHGMQTTKSYTFDTASGEKIEEDDIFADGYGTTLSSLLTAHLTDGRDNPDALSLFVDKIEPNENFYVGKEGITYIYMPYEIAPYSSGTITVTVPWEELKPILK